MTPVLDSSQFSKSVPSSVYHQVGEIFMKLFSVMQVSYKFIVNINLFSVRLGVLNNDCYL